jgi:hypothetical protein
MRLLKPLQFKYLIYSKSLLSNNAQLWLLLFHLLTGWVELWKEYLERPEGKGLQGISHVKDLSRNMKLRGPLRTLFGMDASVILTYLSFSFLVLKFYFISVSPCKQWSCNTEHIVSINRPNEPTNKSLFYCKLSTSHSSQRVSVMLAGLFLATMIGVQ